MLTLLRADLPMLSCAVLTCLPPLPPSVSQPAGGVLTLPRADLLMLGGDLAYPNPSRDTYEQRLFRPFQVIH